MPTVDDIISMAPPPATVAGTGSLTDINGKLYQPDQTTGLVRVPGNLLGDFLSSGFTIAPLSGTTAQRPTSLTYIGLPYFDTTLGRQIWRDANNAEWVDATGTTI